MNYQQPNKKTERARTWSPLVKKILALVLVCLPLGLLAIYQGGKRLSGRSKARILSMGTISATNTPAADTSATNTSAADTPATDTPAADTPATDTPVETTPMETQPVVSSARSASSETPSVEPHPTEKIPVHVTGAVKRPGLYFLPAGALVSDAIDLAGPGPDADLETINLALPLIANSQVRIPSRKEQSELEEGDQGSSPAIPTPYATPLPSPDHDPAGKLAGGQGPGKQNQVERGKGGQEKPGSQISGSPKSGSQDTGLGAKVNLNTASLEDLQKIPGVGPSTAQKILAYRQQNGPFQQVEDLMQVKGIKEGKFAKMVDYIYVP